MNAIGKSGKPGRASNIELLRVASMLLIVLHHFSVHGPWPKSGAFAQTAVLDVCALGGKLGVACFVIITGYFMVSSRFKCRSLLRVVLQTWFYSWLAFSLFSALAPDRVGEDFLQRALMPVVSGEYWFVTCYAALFVASPALNRLARSLGGAERTRLVAVGVAVLSVVPTLSAQPFVFSNFTMFACLYLLGADIRLGEREEDPGCSLPLTAMSPSRLCGRAGAPAVCAACLGFVVLATVAIDWLRAHEGFTALPGRYFMAINSVPVVYLAVAMFILARGRDIGSRKPVNVLASAAFGVYLIHDNPLVRHWLWPHFSFAYALPAWFLPITGVCAAVCIYLACSCVDLARQKALEAPLMKLLDMRFGRYMDAVDRWFRSIEGRDAPGEAVDGLRV